jgi:uncharacterized membrane protein
MNNRPLSLALAASLASTLALSTLPASAQDAGKEKCYGVALKGQNDCAAGKHDCAHMSKINYDKLSFKLVPAGTCTSIKTPKGHGLLTPA